MCLSTVVAVGQERELLGRFISRIRVDGSKVILTDVAGVQTEVQGTIDDIDLVGNVVTIRLT